MHLNALAEINRQQATLLEYQSQALVATTRLKEYFFKIQGGSFDEQIDQEIEDAINETINESTDKPINDQAIDKAIDESDNDQ